MKNKIGHILKTRLLPGLTAIAALGIALPARAALPYPTASTISQFQADCNYANTNGGTFTINLQPNSSVTNLEGVEAYLADIGSDGIGAKNVNLTIIGNGNTFNAGGNIIFFQVFSGSSLTLEQMSLQNGYGDETEGAILNSGTLTISNCTLSGNTSANFNSTPAPPLYGAGGAIWNGGTLIIYNSILSANSGTTESPWGGAIYNAGTLIINNSILSANSCTGEESPLGGAIYNDDGATATISHSILTNNYADSGGGIFNSYGTLTISDCTVSGNTAGYGGGIYNWYGTVTVENSSKISGNAPDDVVNFLGTLYLDSSSEIGILDGNPAILVPSPQISLTTSNAIVISWPYPSTGWSLQQNSDLTTTNWMTPTNTVANDGTNNFIIATPSSDQLFFRLEF